MARLFTSGFDEKFPGYTPVTVSRHFLRRTAEAREDQLRDAQHLLKQTSHFGEASKAKELLHKYHVGVSTKLDVMSYVRGPFGWRVVKLYKKTSDDGHSVD